MSSRDLGSGRACDGQDSASARGDQKRTIIGFDLRPTFLAVITFEIFACVVATALALTLISYYTSKQSTNLCISTGENSLFQMVFQLQSAATMVISRSVDTIVAQPISGLTSVSQVLNRKFFSVRNYDALWPYIYDISFDKGAINYMYYGDVNGDFVGVGEDYPPSTELFISLSDASHLNGGVSRCPLSCPSNGVGINNFTDVRVFNQVTINGDVTIGPFNYSYPFPVLQRPWFLLGASLPPVTYQWTLPYIFIGAYPMTGVTLVKPVYYNMTLYGVLGVDVTFELLTAELQDLTATLTPNAFVVLFDTDGVLYGTSDLQESLFVNTYDPVTNTTSPTSKFINQIQNSNIYTACMAVKETAAAGNLSGLPSSASYQIYGLIFQHILKYVSGHLNLVIIVGAPVNDYIGPIEITRSQLHADAYKYTWYMVISAAISIVIFSLLSIPGTLITIDRPMRVLIKRMEEVSNFDFTSLAGVEKDQRSRIKDIYQIENAFWKMLSSFALGIKNSKKIAECRFSKLATNDHEETNITS